MVQFHFLPSLVIMVMVNVNGPSFLATRHILEFKNRLDHPIFMSRSKRRRGVIHPETPGDDRRTLILPEASQLSDR